MIRLVLCLLFAVSIPLTCSAQELVQDQVTIFKARVITILSEEEVEISGTTASSIRQELRVEILDGTKKGEVVLFSNDYVPLALGQRFFLRHETGPYHTQENYAVLEPDRTGTLVVITGIFLLLLFGIGGMQGIRGLLTLIVSILMIVYVLFPGLLGGASPILLSIGVSTMIIVIGAYVTHGWNRTTTAAVLGMIVTLSVTSTFAYIAILTGDFSGIDGEEAVYLNMNTGGIINFRGLLLGGILIGLLGVLYDAAISQSIAIEELLRAGLIEKKQLFARAMRIGREHIGALVNTLAIAYVGASLPLLLLFYGSESNLLVSMNRELFAGEIIRTMIGGSGVLLTIPLTTIVSIILLTKKK